MSNNNNYYYGDPEYDDDEGSSGEGEELPLLTPLPSSRLAPPSLLQDIFLDDGVSGIIQQPEAEDVEEDEGYFLPTAFFSASSSNHDDGGETGSTIGRGDWVHWGDERDRSVAPALVYSSLPWTQVVGMLMPSSVLECALDMSWPYGALQNVWLGKCVIWLFVFKLLAFLDKRHSRISVLCMLFLLGIIVALVSKRSPLFAYNRRGLRFASFIPRPQLPAEAASRLQFAQNHPSRPLERDA